MRNRSMFVSLVTIVVAMYIGMWVFVGISPRISPDSAGKAQVGKAAVVTLVDGGETLGGVYEGKDGNWLYLRDPESKAPVWVPLTRVGVVQFAE